eukprot:scaffold30210_cov59-Phaeocystis_antarctica.AAC.2
MLSSASTARASPALSHADAQQRRGAAPRGGGGRTVRGDRRAVQAPPTEHLQQQLDAHRRPRCRGRAAAWSKCLPRQRPSSAPAPPQGAQPLPRVLELAASKAAHFTAFDHSGAAHPRSPCRSRGARCQARLALTLSLEWPREMCRRLTLTAAPWL